MFVLRHVLFICYYNSGSRNKSRSPDLSYHTLNNMRHFKIIISCKELNKLTISCNNKVTTLFLIPWNYLMTRQCIITLIFLKQVSKISHTTKYKIKTL